MEISIRADDFFKIHSNMLVNLINTVKQQIIVKARSFTYNRLCHTMEIKPEDLLKTGYKNMAFKTASVTDSITAISSKGLKLYYKRLYHNLKLKTD